MAAGRTSMVKCLLVLSWVWLIVAAGPVAVAANGDEDRSNRPLVIFVLGMNTRFEGSWSHGVPQDLYDLMSLTQIAADLEHLGANTDFAVFSYSNRYADTEKHLAVYDEADTCGRIEDNYDRLFRSWYDYVYPGHSTVHIVTHSMGGVVALSAMTDTSWSPTNLASVTTLDSPLRGRPLAEFGPYLPADGCWPWEALRYQDLTPGSDVIKAIKGLDTNIGWLATVGNKEDAVVGAKDSTHPRAWLSTTIDEACWDPSLLMHGCVFGSTAARQAVINNILLGSGISLDQQRRVAGLTLVGTDADDVIRGTARSEVIDGLGGRDTLRGNAGDDSLYGGSGSDRLFGGRGNDWLEGESARDVFNGGPGFDHCSLSGEVGRGCEVTEGDTSVRVQVSARTGWQRTGVVVEAGDVVSVSVVSGTWTHWEGGRPYNGGQGDTTYICANVMPASECFEPDPYSPQGALIGEIENWVVGIGTANTFTAQRNGELLLRINDLYVADNDGELTVDVVVRS